MNETPETMTEELKARRYSNSILKTEIGINKTLTQANNVSPYVMTHYTNLNTGENGLKNLIKEILTNNGSIFPNNSHNTELRAMVIAGSMYTEDIIGKVKEIFSRDTKRYTSVRTHLGVFMLKEGTVNCIQLTGKEDFNRTSPRPRKKWYLVQ